MTLARSCRTRWPTTSPTASPALKANTVTSRACPTSQLRIAKLATFVSRVRQTLARTNAPTMKSVLQEHFTPSSALQRSILSRLKPHRVTRALLAIAALGVSWSSALLALSAPRTRFHTVLLAPTARIQLSDNPRRLTPAQTASLASSACSQTTDSTVLMALSAPVIPTTRDLTRIPRVVGSAHPVLSVAQVEPSQS